MSTDRTRWSRGVGLVLVLLPWLLGACSQRVDSSLDGVLPPGRDAAFRWRPSDGRLEVRAPVMGIEARLVIDAPSEPAARDGAVAALARLHQLDAVMSDWRDESELMSLCRAAGGAPVPVSDDLFRVLRRGQEIARASDGAFDMTIGPVVRLWRAARRTGRMPEADHLARARDLVGHHLLVLDEHERTARLVKPGMQLDLGGIGKGFAADEALRMLREHGCGTALVDLGGDIVCGDPPPGRDGWRIDIESGSIADGPATTHRLDVRRQGVATSGAAFQSVTIDGVQYSHIVDPRTGIGLTHQLAVTVIAPDAATADALASAVSVLGVERGRDLVDRFPDATLFITEGRATRSASDVSMP